MIALRDETVQPPFTETLRLEQLSIGNLDSTRPGSRANVKLQAQVEGGRGKIDVDGWAVAFEPKPDFDLQARIEELSLPVLSPVLAPQIGLGIIDGRLDALATGVAADGRLKGEARATVRDLVFVDQPAASGDPLAKAIGVPLNTLIDLLQDSDGTIDLKVPFEGDLLSPDFDFSHVIWTGILRVLRALIVSPFKLISSSAALISAGPSGGTSATRAAEDGLPTLAPIRFTPAKSEIDAAAEEGVRILRGLLHERPRLSIAVCGVAVGQDLDVEAASASASRQAELQAAAAPRLRALAEDRTLAAIRALEGDGGATADQLRRCAEPRVLDTDDGPPRAELAF